MATSIKFWNVPEKINNYNVRLEFDGDKTDLRLHLESNFRWGSKTKKEYLKAQKLIDAIGYKGNGWNVYAWYDVSGYEYWMKQMQETNYIQITIAFDKQNVKLSELDKLYAALDNALQDAEMIENNYSYNPDKHEYA